MENKGKMKEEKRLDAILYLVPLALTEQDLIERKMNKWKEAWLSLVQL